MMSAGWYSMQRGWQDHPVFPAEPYTQREAWEWIISNASFSDRRVRVGPDIVNVPRGDLAASLRYMAKAWKWKSDTRVRNFLKRIEAEGMIKIGKTDVQKSLQITVCNYDAYQRYERTENADKTQTERKREKGNNSSVAKATGEASSPPDPKKVVFDSGVKLLMSAGKAEVTSRSIIGKWVKAHGVGAVIDALSAAQSQGVIEPVGWIEKRWQTKTAHIDHDGAILNHGMRLRKVRPPVQAREREPCRA